MIFFLSHITSWINHESQNFQEHKNFYRRGGKYSAEKLVGFEKCVRFLFLKGLDESIGDLAISPTTIDKLWLLNLKLKLKLKKFIS